MTYQFRIRLLHVNNPEVWRQITIPAHYTFRQFHEIIQTAIGWDGDEVYEFLDVPQRTTAKINIGQFGLLTNGWDGHRVILSEIFNKTKSFYYLYDLEENWMHEIILEKTSNDTVAHASCLSGGGACPPMNCGGPAGLEHLKQVMADPSHPEYEQMRISHKLPDGENFEFSRFDTDETVRKIETAGRPFRNYLLAEHTIDNHKYGLNRQLWSRIDDINARFTQGKYNMVHELKELTLKYPGIPHFKNMLAAVSLVKNDRNRFLEMVQEVIRDFPGHILSRTNLAAHYMHEGELDKALELLAEDLDLNSLYPDREGYFTVTEIYNFHAVAFRYQMTVEDDREAKKHLELLEQYCYEKTVEDRLLTQFMQLRLSKLRTGNKRTVEVIPVLVPPSDRAPIFTHPEIELLYASGYQINRDELRRIMELPRESLILDLEKVIIDSIARFDQFADMEWGAATHSFPQHALYILSALEAEEALETLIILMSQSDELLHFWFGDIVTEEFIHFIYRMGQNQVARLKEFIFAPNCYTYIRTAVSETVFQIALHQPYRLQEVIDWFESALKYMLKHTNNDNIFDTQVFSSLIYDFSNIANRNHLPLIEECFATGLVDESSIGTLENIKLKLYKKTRKSLIKVIPESIEQFYNNWAKWFDTSNHSAQVEEKDDKDLKLPQRSATATKAGRNDPCPCGSGKKYKKCCGAN